MFFKIFNSINKRRIYVSHIFTGVANKYGRHCGVLIKKRQLVEPVFTVEITEVLFVGVPVPPWVGYDEEDVIQEQILALSAVSTVIKLQQYIIVI